MMELSFQGIVTPPFKRGAYTLSKRHLRHCGGARRPPRPPARVPSYLEEASGWEGLKCPPCPRTGVHHVFGLNTMKSQAQSNRESKWRGNGSASSIGIFAEQAFWRAAGARLIPGNSARVLKDEVSFRDHNLVKADE